jgi:hypothetical protein
MRCLSNLAQIIGEDFGPKPNRGDGDEAGTGRRRCRTGPPAPPGQKGNRNQNPELRLVDQQSQKTAGKNGAPIKQAESGAEQRRRPGSILSGDGVDEDRRRGERQQKRTAVRHGDAERAIKREPPGA